MISFGTKILRKCKGRAPIRKKQAIARKIRCFPCNSFYRLHFNAMLRFSFYPFLACGRTTFFDSLRRRQKCLRLRLREIFCLAKCEIIYCVNCEICPFGSCEIFARGECVTIYEINCESSSRQVSPGLISMIMPSPSGSSMWLVRDLFM